MIRQTEPKAELVSQVKDRLGSFSNSTFDTIRKDAGLPAADKGGKGPLRRFSIAQVKKLIKTVESGTFLRKDEIAAALRDLIGSHHN